MEIREQVVFDLVAEVAVIKCMTGGPSTLQEPSQAPRDSSPSAASSKSKVSAPSGKCPQEMTV
jgi:hypothetical protein